VDFAMNLYIIPSNFNQMENLIHNDKDEGSLVIYRNFEE